MTCHELKNKLELYFDNELSIQEKAEIEAHLSSCADCAETFAHLQALDSLGKKDFFPEPSPLYWRELQQNIMKEIKAGDKKSTNLAALLQQVKNFFAAPKVSYRVAGLVATAVIVFFIIQISFMRQGKFELPQTIDVSDSISLEEHETRSIEIQAEEPPALPGRIETPFPPTIPKAAPSQESDRDHLLINQVEPPAMMKAAERDMGILHDPSRLIEPELTIEAEGVIGQQDRKKSFSDETAPSRREAKRVNSKPAYMYFEKNDLSSKDAARAKSAAVRESATLRDSSYFKYQLTLRKVEEISDLTEKIETWEGYIHTQPTVFFLRRAKYEQAQIYSELARKKSAEDHINLAIKFYENNFEHLTAIADSSQIESELDALRQLLKKSRME